LQHASYYGIAKAVIQRCYTVQPSRRHATVLAGCSPGAEAARPGSKHRSAVPTPFHVARTIDTLVALANI
jgi:hypothetical protein